MLAASLTLYMIQPWQSPCTSFVILDLTCLIENIEQQYWKLQLTQIILKVLSARKAVSSVM